MITHLCVMSTGRQRCGQPPGHTGRDDHHRSGRPQGEVRQLQEIRDTLRQVEMCAQDIPVHALLSGKYQ